MIVSKIPDSIDRAYVRTAGMHISPEARQRGAAVTEGMSVDEILTVSRLMTAEEFGVDEEAKATIDAKMAEIRERLDFGDEEDDEPGEVVDFFLFSPKPTPDSFTGDEVESVLDRFIKTDQAILCYIFGFRFVNQGHSMEETIRKFELKPGYLSDLRTRVVKAISSQNS